jgi:hypothetical protein
MHECSNNNKRLFGSDSGEDNFPWFWLNKEFLTMTHPPPGHVQQLTSQMAHLDAFSHVDECIFLLQQDNVICQALLDSWGDSGNPFTI